MPDEGRGSTKLGSAWTLGVRTIRDSFDDRLPGLAAEMAFYILLSLPPLLLVGLGAVGYIGELFGPETVDTVRLRILKSAGAVLTPSTMRDVVGPAVDRLLEQGRADILSVGAVLALWSGSRALRVTVQAVTIAYDLEDRRSWWQHRLLSLGLTFAGILTGAVLLPLLVAGPRAGESLASRYGLAEVFDLVWRILYYPVVVLLGLAVLTWVYHVVPPVRTAWRRDFPGAILAFVVWLAASTALRIYALQFVETNSPYSAFGTPLVMLLWIYVSGVALLVGAELNAEIEKMWPTADGPYAEAEADLPNGEAALEFPRGGAGL